MDLDDDRPPSPPNTSVVVACLPSNEFLDIPFNLERDESPSPAFRNHTASPGHQHRPPPIARSSPDLLTFDLDTDEPKLTLTPRCLVFGTASSISPEHIERSRAVSTSVQPLSQPDRHLAVHRPSSTAPRVLLAVHDGRLPEGVATNDTSVIGEDDRACSPLSHASMVSNQALHSPPLSITGADATLTNTCLSYDFDLDDDNPPTPLIWGSVTVSKTSLHNMQSTNLASLSFDFRLDDDMPYSPLDMPDQVKTIDRPCGVYTALQSPIHLTPHTRGITACHTRSLNDIFSPIF